MEKPTLGVEASGARIVRHTDRGPCGFERIQCAGLCGASVCGCQNAQVAAGLHVVMQSIEHRRNTGMTNECHDQIDRVCRVDFREQLTADGGFPRGVCQDSGVEQRNQRWPNGLTCAIDPHPVDRLQNAARRDRPLGQIERGGELGVPGLRLFHQSSNQPADEVDADGNPVFLVNGCNKPFDNCGDVERKPIGCFCRSQLFITGVRRIAKVFQLFAERLGEQRFVDAVG